MSFSLVYNSTINTQKINYTIQSSINEQIQNKIGKLIEKNNNTPTLPFNTRIKATLNDLD